MEKLTIEIPDAKNLEVKKILREMGVVFIEEKSFDKEAYRKKLLRAGEWTEEDLKAMDIAKIAFNSLKVQDSVFPAS